MHLQQSMTPLTACWIASGIVSRYAAGCATLRLSLLMPALTLTVFVTVCAPASFSGNLMPDNRFYNESTQRAD